MNGCRGGSGTATGRCVAGAPMNAFSEPAWGPSGIGGGGAAARRAASSTKAAARTAAFTAAKDRAKAGAQAPVTARRAGSPCGGERAAHGAPRDGEPARRAVTGASAPAFARSFAAVKAALLAAARPPPRRPRGRGAAAPDPRGAGRGQAAGVHRALPPRPTRSRPPTHRGIPFMAPNGRSNIHDDAYQTDTYKWAGPLGTTSPGGRRSFAQRVCLGDVRRARAGWSRSAWASSDRSWTMLDPEHAGELGDVPCRRAARATRQPFTDFAGGGYFYLDNQDRAVIPTTTATSSWSPRRRRRLRARARLRPHGRGPRRRQDHLGAARLERPDLVRVARTGSSAWSTRRPARSGARHGRADRQLVRGRRDGGVYIVTDKALYRFDAAPAARRTVTGASATRTRRSHKPGQTERGLGHDADADGRRPRRDHRQRRPDERRRLQARADVSGRGGLRQPVFAKGASDTDKSLIGAGASIVVENNYGYSGPPSTEPGQDDDARARARRPRRRRGGCHKVWHSRRDRPIGRAEAVAGERPRLHVHQADRGHNADAWYLTAIDFRTGKTVFKHLGGHGPRLQQQLRAGHDRPGRHRLRRRCSAGSWRCGTSRRRPGPRPPRGEAGEAAADSGCTCGGWGASARGCG